MIKVSVTVPIYNAGPFLRQCLDSLSEQSLSEIEFILVDDGSTDGSSIICDEYASRDSRFKVFHKVNGGSASARQLGLECSRGKYYIVCDADDWVESTMYEELYNKAEKECSDIVICDSFYEYSNGTKRLVKGLKEGLSQENFLRGIITGQYAGTTWNKLIRMSILMKYNISYESGINHGEDVLFLMKLLSFPISICVLSRPFYHYRRQFFGNTYTNCPTMKTFEQISFVFNWKIVHFSVSKYDRELFICAINYLFTAMRTANMSKKEYKKILSKYFSFISLIKYRVYSLKSLLILISKINYEMSMFLFRRMYKYFYR